MLRPQWLALLGASAIRGPRNIGIMRKLWKLSTDDRLLLLEATLWLGVAGTAIAVLPFRHLGRLASCPVRLAVPPQQTRQMEVKRVRWAIITAARRIPWLAMCFQQGLAAQFMLRRRGIPSVLYYGAASDRRGLSAHVWVRDGSVDVLGGELASGFALLTTFPHQDSPA
jgi:hypothetical protein